MYNNLIEKQNGFCCTKNKLLIIALYGTLYEHTYKQTPIHIKQ